MLELFVQIVKAPVLFVTVLALQDLVRRRSAALMFSLKIFIFKITTITLHCHSLL